MGDEPVGVCGRWAGSGAGVVLEVWGEGEGVESVCGGGLGVMFINLFCCRCNIPVSDLVAETGGRRLRGGVMDWV